MRRTLKLLGLIGAASAAAVAAARRTASPTVADAALPPARPLPSVSQELRQALSRFDERFGA
ncbi:MAG: hypothetical protein HKO82_03100 [Acidimicrobiia bacterium]|nr:hypothetical protein [Acidimicrobiia bacterium]NNF87470.1 hypothetical protein [Acidimicrobiia bacterium]NNJ47430.1 hypothetical protein [Acidimicrobiia bacterium]NNL12658.1 hypothetical protein [Acidimicrobiia bacterium]